MSAGGERVAELIAAHAGTVFAVAGASHTHLLDPLDRLGVRIVSSRHESGAVGAADGYSRVMAGSTPARPGIALIVAEQGLPNAIGGLAVAHTANAPVLVIAATPPRGFAEAEAGLDQDQLALVTPISKWARTVPTAARLVDHVATALKQALSGRPGPVILLVPQDFFRAEADGPAAPVRLPRAPLADDADIAAAAELLASARRPIVISGTGAFRGRAGPALNVLAHEFGVPVFGNGLGRGLVAEDWERSFSWPFAQIAAREADVAVVVGARLTQRLGFGLPPRFAPDVRLIQIDIHAEAFHRNRPVDAALHGGTGPTLEALVAKLRPRRREAWDRGWLREALAARTARHAELKARRTDPPHPLALGAAIATRLPADAVLVGDGADIQNWMYGAIAVRRPGGFLDHYPMGAMGSGTALAVGAAAALHELAGPTGTPPPTLLVTGDGSIGFHPAELHAAALAGLDLKVVVGNDGAWGTEAHGQAQAIGRTVNTELGVLPYAKLAEAFGCAGATCDRHEDLGPALDRLFATPGPALLDVRIDRAAGAELKRDPVVSTIMFSDLNEGRSQFETRGEDA